MFTFLTTTTSTGTTGVSTIIMFAVLIAVFYFFLIRPENKKKKAMEAMRSALTVGDKITTIGGIVGTVVHIKDDNIVIETSADRVRLELAKWCISTNNTAEAAKAAAKPERKNKK
ncbi:MAG: preprotein translocase subunit YajC [Oscillospiraceae bacterium]|nr:preprotein translocase subunit YajC [Oscillospiraceae bacterium]